MIDNWPQIKEKLYDELIDKFSGEEDNKNGITFGEAIDLFKKILDFNLVRKEFEGVKEAIYSGLEDYFLNGKELDGMYKLISKLEAFIKKVCLLSHKEITSKNDKEKTLGILLQDLDLATKKIIHAETIEEVKSVIKFEEHVGITYVSRNLESHQAHKYTKLEITTIVTSALVTYLYVLITQNKILRFELPKPYFQEYLNEVIINFKKWNTRYIQVEGLKKEEENFDHFNRTLVKSETDQDNDNKIAEEENINEINKGTVRNETINGLVDKLNRSGITPLKSGLKKAKILELREKLPHMVILGHPGIGKSTTLQYIAFLDARKIIDYTETNVKFPVYIELKQYQGENHIWNTIKKRFGIDDDTLNKLFEDGMLTLLLDGLNEVVENFLKMKLEIERYINEFPKLSVIISSRPQIYNNKLFDIPAYTIQPMNEDQIKEFFDKNITIFKNKKKYYEIVRQQENLYQLCKIPLICGMLIEAIETSNGVMPSNKGILIKWFVKNIYNREEKNKNNQTNRDSKNIILSYLAYQTRKLSMVGFSLSSAIDLINEVKKEKDLTAIDPVLFIREVTDNNILEKDQEDGLSYSHEILQEYFAAEHLFSIGLKGMEIIESFVDKTFWEQIIIIYSGLCKNMSEFLRKILYRDTLLAAKALVSSIENEDEIRREIIIKADSDARNFEDEDSSVKGFLSLIELQETDTLNDIIININKPTRIHFKIIKQIIDEGSVEQVIKFLNVLSEHKRSYALIMRAYEALYEKKYEALSGDEHGLLKKILGNLSKLRKKYFMKCSLFLLNAFKVNITDYKIITDIFYYVYHNTSDKRYIVSSIELIKNYYTFKKNKFEILTIIFENIKEYKYLYYNKIMDLIKFYDINKDILDDEINNFIISFSIQLFENKEYQNILRLADKFNIDLSHIINEKIDVIKQDISELIQNNESNIEKILEENNIAESTFILKLDPDKISPNNKIRLAANFIKKFRLENILLSEIKVSIKNYIANLINKPSNNNDEIYAFPLYYSHDIGGGIFDIHEIIDFFDLTATYLPEIRKYINYLITSKNYYEAILVIKKFNLKNEFKEKILIGIKSILANLIDPERKSYPYEINNETDKFLKILSMLDFGDTFKNEIIISINKLIENRLYYKALILIIKFNFVELYKGNLINIIDHSFSSSGGYYNDTLYYFQSNFIDGLLSLITFLIRLNEFKKISWILDSTYDENFLDTSCDSISGAHQILLNENQRNILKNIIELLMLKKIYISAFKLIFLFGLNQEYLNKISLHIDQAINNSDYLDNSNHGHIFRYHEQERSKIVDNIIDTFFLMIEKNKYKEALYLLIIYNYLLKRVQNKLNFNQTKFKKHSNLIISAIIDLIYENKIKEAIFVKNILGIEHKKVRSEALLKIYSFVDKLVEGGEIETAIKLKNEFGMLPSKITSVAKKTSLYLSQNNFVLASDLINRFGLKANDFPDILKELSDLLNSRKYEEILKFLSLFNLNLSNFKDMIIDHIRIILKEKTDDNYDLASKLARKFKLDDKLAESLFNSDPD